jgi:hypothetical protein
MKGMVAKKINIIFISLKFALKINTGNQNQILVT